MRAYYNENTGYVVRFSSDEYNLPFIDVINNSEVIEKISQGFVARVLSGAIIFEQDKSLLLKDIREQRKCLLEEADAKVNKIYDDSRISGTDVDHNMLVLISVYRQALRDIVETQVTSDIVWPERPW